MSDRKPVVTKAELDSLNDEEIVEGYLNAFEGITHCGDNRSKAYWHGWRNGMNDKASKVDDAQRALINDCKRS